MDILIDGEIVLYGAVGESFWSDSFTDRDVILALNELSGSEEITVRINSGGGDAFMGLTIYNALKACSSNIVVYVDGIAASAASVIAMGADKLVMNEGSMMMIHDPSSITFGDAADHEKTHELLNKLGDQMATLYSRKANDGPEEIRDMMRAETWLTSGEAVELGFADEADGEHQAVAASLFDYRVYANAPEELKSMAVAYAATLKPTPRENYERTETVTQQVSQQASISTPEGDDAEPIDVDKLTAEASDKERERILAITTHDAADGRTDLAAFLAFKTNRSVDECVATLQNANKKEAKQAEPKVPTAQTVEPMEAMDGSGMQMPAPKLNANEIYAKRRVAR